MGKVRIDILLAEKGLVPSREKARAIILAGEVKVNGSIVDKAGTKVDEEAELQIDSGKLKYVSRGGYKLEGAIKDFNIDFCGKIVLDVGASTGGYTDCALQNGAEKVYALDVGYGQFDWSLRNDSRVEVFERTNIRYFTLEDLGEQVDIITMDVSFISTTLIFPVLCRLLKDDGEIISLIKPQFEAGKEKVGKKGVVRDSLVHEEVIQKCVNSSQKNGLICTGISYSPLTGPQGNIEYFIHLKKDIEALEDIYSNIKIIVEKAHDVLGVKSR